MWAISRIALGRIFAQDALVTLQRPLMIRTLGEPVGDTDLRGRCAGGHGDARPLTVGDDLFQTELSVAENGDEGNEHGNPFVRD